MRCMPIIDVYIRNIHTIGRPVHTSSDKNRRSEQIIGSLFSFGSPPYESRTTATKSETLGGGIPRSPNHHRHKKRVQVRLRGELTARSREGVAGWTCMLVCGFSQH